MAEKCDLCLWNQGSGGGGGGSTTLAGLTDVDISNPSNGQTLVYDAASSKWVNGSGGGVLVVHEDGSTAQLDKTWQEIADAMTAGKPVFINTPMEEGRSTGFVACAYIEDGNYVLYVVTFFGVASGELTTYTTDSSSGYPIGSN